MATYVKLGDTLNLEIQLSDGDKFPSTRVFAQIDELDYTPIVAEFELTKVGPGKYTSTTQTMPAYDAILVTYYIRKSNGTSPETKYNPYYLTEVFLRDYTAEVVQDDLSAILSALNSTDLVGTVNEDNVILAEIDTEYIDGIIYDNETITGEITNEP